MSDEIDRMAREGDGERLAALLSPTGESNDAEPTVAVPPRISGTPQAGQFVDRYKLLQEIGEGGFGTVFMAEQQKPVVRRVALKVIKVGMDTRQVIARFEAERQALAIMDHPNIAKVFDAGQTESGRPYFVMELIRGIPITEYCDQNNLSVRDRLALFVQVCQAAQHAHTKGVIHRDIKPSNVLVTMHDGVPIPKVIDFGVAKAIDRPLTEKTLFTEHRQIVGTPEYMSPEQAEMGGIDIDTRSDVYSLGVLLYELLTGTTPFDAKELRAKGYAEIQRIVREVEPPEPSARVSSLGQTLGTVAKHRDSDPGRLFRLIRGELDWVVMKCLEKDRTRRYETANGLARDVQRYLNDETVEASPPTVRYRLGKFIRRYRVPLAAASAFAVMLIAATGASAWQALRATRAQNAEAWQHKLADQATAKEVAQRKQAEATANLLESIFRGIDPDEERGGQDLNSRLATTLDKAAARLESEYSGDPLVRARLRVALGSTELTLGARDKADALFRAALDEQRVQLGPDDPECLRTQSKIGEVYIHAGRYDEAGTLFGQLLDREVTTLGANHPETLNTLNLLAYTRLYAEQYANAIKLFEEYQYRQLKTFGPLSADNLWKLRGLASAYRKASRTTDAIRLLEQLRDGQIRELGEDHPETLGTLLELALAERDAGRTSFAIKLLESVRDKQVQKLGPEHYNTLTTLAELARVYLNVGRATEAVVLLERVLPARTRVLGPDHPETLFAQSGLALAYRCAGRFGDSAALAVKHLERKPGDHQARYVLACLQCYLGDEAAYRANCAELVRRFGGTSDRAIAERTAKACLLVPNGVSNLGAVANLADEGVVGPPDSLLRFYQFTQGLAQYRAGDFDEALQWLGRSRANFVRVIARESETQRKRFNDGEYVVTTDFLLAMVQRRSGHEQDALKTLSVARNEFAMQVPPVSSGDIRVGGEDWLIVQIIAREAEAMFGKAGATTQTAGK
ncbi:MAG TPA: serine/threonine-protein kinase [Tepidisphaeraceae bacterium]|jgi:serine/threonine protein kinase/tetratricopeptide (TPR) repeat protein|nr:serine/threonine-protein kinase [Tepidisphaeraceae bacterium]